MTASANSIPLAFRVGVTGTRRIDRGAEVSVRAAISQVLYLVSQQLEELAQAQVPKASYEQPTNDRLGRLRLVSPVAEGSDRLVAQEALKAGYALYVPMPFPQSEYERDFSNSIEEFRILISRAEILELDGTRALANESYREVGRFVVRNCDLLIAVWDGQPERGVGGTAEIVRFAVNLGVPVWQIDPSGQSLPRFIGSPQALRAVSFPDGDTELRNYIERTIVPPKTAGVERPGAFGRLAHILSDSFRPNASPLAEYLSEPELQTSGIWQVYSVVMNALMPKAQSGVGTEPSSSAPSSEDHWWSGYFRRADRLSEAYGARYRSSYVLIAVFAVIVAASGLLPNRLKILADATDALGIITIAALILANYCYRWHERWISYRLLAELLRKQAILWTIGQSLPMQEILQSTLTSEDLDDGEQSALPRDAWIGWYFAAVTRSAPLLIGSLESRKGDAAASAYALIREQLRYHRLRIIRSKAAATSMMKAGQFFLLLAATVVFLKLVFWFTHRADSVVDEVRALGHFLSTVAASFLALRVYSELPLLAQQSSRMIKILKNIECQLTAIEICEPAASWELGQIMSTLALSMMQEVTGWMQLFRVKPIQPPDLR